MADTDFTIKNGQTWSYDLTVTLDSSAVTLGTTGDTWALSGSVMAKHYSTDKVVDFTFTTTDASAGESTMSLTPAETSKLPYVDAVYDVEMQNNSSGKVYRILEGTIISDQRLQNNGRCGY